MVEKDTEVAEHTEQISHGDTKTQRKHDLGVSVSLWLIPSVFSDLSVSRADR
jgi:hypothetical protein